MAECYVCGVNTELVEDMSKVVDAAESLVDAAAEDDKEAIVAAAVDLRLIVQGYRANKTIEQGGENAVQ